MKAMKLQILLRLNLAISLLTPLSGQCFHHLSEDTATRKSSLQSRSFHARSPHDCGRSRDVMRTTGPIAAANPFRFSTDYQARETDSLFYGYRYYNPSTGRWLSRDPAEENGGNNIYVFGNNSPANNFDILGLNVCGVNSLRLTPRGWKYASGYGSLFFEFDIEAQLREDWGLACMHFDPKCCRYVQWVNAYVAVGGIVIRTARGGVPMSDGLAHLDYRPYRGDSLEEAVKSGTFPVPTGTSYKTYDDPGIHFAPLVLTPGTTVDFQYYFTGVIVDSCHNNARVASATIYADAKGTLFRGLTVTPPPLRTSTFP